MKTNTQSPLLKGLSFDNDKGKKEKVNEVLRNAVDMQGEYGKESFEEAFNRILSMKNTDKDRERILEVKEALVAGKLERTTEKVGKRLSKKEVLELYGDILEEKRQERIAEIRKTIPEHYVTVKTAEDLEDLIKFIDERIEGNRLLGFDIETFGEKSGDALNMFEGNIAGFSVGDTKEGYYLPLSHTERTELNRMLSNKDIIKAIKPQLEGVKTVMHNAPFDCKWMKLHYDVDMVTNLHADTRVMAFMSNEEEPNHQLKHLTEAWLKEEADYFEELFPEKDAFNKVPLDIATFYAVGDTVKTAKLYEYILKIWNQAMRDIKKLFFEVEMPVMRYFIRSDLQGITLDFDRNRELYDAQVAKTEEIQKEIEELYGKEINLNSPVQIATMLYDHFKLPDITFKRKTDKDTLEELKEYHEVVKMLSNYRVESKLLSSFTLALSEKAVDGIIHPEHNTLGAKTGRFTCKNPKVLGLCSASYIE